MKWYLLSFIFISFQAFSREKIKDYQASKKTCSEKSNEKNKWLEWRNFKKDKNQYSLLLDPEKLLTTIKLTNDLSCTDSINPSISLYESLIHESTLPPYPLKNDGIIRLDHSKGYFLTLDLCPSLKGEFEMSFFEKLKELSLKNKKTIPLGIAITGKWIRKNKHYFEMLKNLSLEKNLSITWINHTNHHYYNPELPFKENFMLARPWSLESEILDLEKTLIEHGVIPSIFFRFPGLISNQSLFQKVTSLSLIPLGSDSWIAKHELPKRGSIILLHGNGNESYGIKRFENWLFKSKTPIHFLSLEQDVKLE
jgi:hypothetical protein